MKIREQKWPRDPGSKGKLKEARNRVEIAVYQTLGDARILALQDMISDLRQIS